MIVVRHKPLALIVVVGIFGGIVLSSALGYWKTTSSKEPALIQAGEFAGLPNPSDIRGSYTWNDVAKAFNLPVESLFAAFGASDPAAKVNSLEAIYGGKLPEGVEIGTDSVRLFVALMTGLPHDSEGDTVLPASAIPLLKTEALADPARIDAAAAKAVTLSVTPGAAAPASASAAASQEAASGAAKGAASVAAPAPSMGAAAGGDAEASKAAPKAPSAPEAPPAPAAPQEGPAPEKAAPAAAQSGAAQAPAAGAEHSPTAGAITGKTSFNDLKTWGCDMKKVEELLGGLGPSAQAVKDYVAAKGLSFSEIKPKLQALVP